MSEFYILSEDKQLVPCDINTWGKWRSENINNRVVEHTYVDGIFYGKDSQGALISTVFTGIDHSFGEGPPQVFETMILDSAGGDDFEYQTRCSTYAEALEMHKAALKYFDDRPLL